jgi:hypothetical protein
VKIGTDPEVVFLCRSGVLLRQHLEERQQRRLQAEGRERERRSDQEVQKGRGHADPPRRQDPQQHQDLLRVVRGVRGEATFAEI